MIWNNVNFQVLKHGYFRIAFGMAIYVIMYINTW